MAWKEVSPDGVPKLDFEHPRVKAAMKVVGVHERDLTGKPPVPKKSPLSARLHLTSTSGGAAGAKAEETSGAQSARAELVARSKELWERKQVQLLHEIEETADAMADEEVEAILSPKQTGVLETSQQLLDKEKDRIEKMRQRQTAQLQRTARRKLERFEVREAAEKTREEKEELRLEREKERQQKLAETMEKTAAQHQKAREKVHQGAKDLVDRRREILRTLAKQSDHVSAMMKDRFSGESEKQKEIQNRMAHIAESILAQEQQDIEKNAQRVEDSTRRHGEVHMRLQQARQEQAQKLSEKRTKFSGKLGEVCEKQENEEQEREQQFLRRAAELEAAHARKAQKTKDLVQVSKENREKQMTRWTANQQKNREARREMMKGLRSKMKTDQEKSLAVREQYLDEGIFAHAASRSVMQELVEANKARLARSQDTSREQTLAKVERDRARTNATSDFQKQLQNKRAGLIKESMDGRCKVEELHGLDPSSGEANTKRINEILTHLGLEPWSPPKTAKEEEEGQQK